MTLKGLDKLRSTEYADEILYHDFSVVVDMNRELANEIEAEQEKYYLPLPLDTDGNPVQKGTRYKAIGKTLHASVCIDVESLYITVGSNDNWAYSENAWEFKRADRDTQEHIDADAMLPPDQYCKKYDLPPQAHDMYALDREKSKHLLERQRKLLGGDER